MKTSILLPRLLIMTSAVLGTVACGGGGGSGSSSVSTTPGSNPTPAPLTQSNIQLPTQVQVVSAK